MNEFDGDNPVASGDDNDKLIVMKMLVTSLLEKNKDYEKEVAYHLQKQIEKIEQRLQSSLFNEENK